MHQDIVHPVPAKKHGLASEVIPNGGSTMDGGHAIDDASGIVVGHGQEVEVSQIGEPLGFKKAPRVPKVWMKDVDGGVGDEG